MVVYRPIAGSGQARTPKERERMIVPCDKPSKSNSHEKPEKPYADECRNTKDHADDEPAKECPVSPQADS